MSPAPDLSPRATTILHLFLSCETQVIPTFGGVAGVLHSEVRAKAAECGIEPSADFWDLFQALEVAWRGYVNPKPKDE